MLHWAFDYLSKSGSMLICVSKRGSWNVAGANVLGAKPIAMIPNTTHYQLFVQVAFHPRHCIAVANATELTHMNLSAPHMTQYKCHPHLTHWGRGKIAAIFQTFANAFFNENIWLSIKILLNIVPRDPTNNIPALVQIKAWLRPGDKPLSRPMMT